MSSTVAVIADFQAQLTGLGGDRDTHRVRPAVLGRLFLEARPAPQERELAFVVADDGSVASMVYPAEEETRIASVWDSGMGLAATQEPALSALVAKPP